jgi:hypothetical protein
MFSSQPSALEGGTGRGTGLSARCSPSAASSLMFIASDEEAAERAGVLFQLQSAPRLTDQGLRAALCAACTDVTPSGRRSMAVRWRERPRDLAGSAITPAATEEVAHATLSVSQPEQAISSMRPGQPAKVRTICTCLHRPSDSIVRFAVAHSRRSALLRPRMRAAGGLDRAIREPLERNYRRPHVNLLTTRGDGGIFELSSTVAISNPLHIARCEAHESTAPGHDSFLSRFTCWSPTRATTRPRRKQS